MVDPEPDAFFSPSFTTFPDATAGVSHASALPAIPAIAADPTAGAAAGPVTVDAWFAPPAPTSMPAPAPPATPGSTPLPAPPVAKAHPVPAQRSAAPVRQAAPPAVSLPAAVPTPTYQPAPPPAQPRKTRWGGRSTGGAIAGTGLLAKVLLTAKSIGLLALHFKTAASMLVSVAAYALLWGWSFAVGFVLLMFVHELGHVYVLRKQGVKATAPMFIPFLGAFVSVKGPQRSVAAEAVSALAGPAAGLAASGLVFVFADAYHSPFLRALAYTGFLLNLFNLIPALPLDGGRVAGAVHPAIWFGGLVAAGGYLLYVRSPLIIFLALIGVPETIRRWRARRVGADTAYMTIPTQTRWQIAAAYVAVAALCIAGMGAAYSPAHFG